MWPGCLVWGVCEFGSYLGFDRFWLEGRVATCCFGLSWRVDIIYQECDFLVFWCLFMVGCSLAPTGCWLVNGLGDFLGELTDSWCTVLE